MGEHLFSSGDKLSLKPTVLLERIDSLNYESPFSSRDEVDSSLTKKRAAEDVYRGLQDLEIIYEQKSLKLKKSTEKDIGPSRNIFSNISKNLNRESPLKMDANKLIALREREMRINEMVKRKGARFIDDNAKEELEALSQLDRQLGRPQTRPVFPSSIRERGTKGFQKPIYQALHSDVTSTDQTLLNCLQQTAKTLEEKYRILDSRDKLYQSRRERTLHGKHRLVGTCPDMCPEKERMRRCYQMQVSIFEMKDYPTNTEVKEEWMVKEYARSSADQDTPLPHDLRPVPVLQRTMAHLCRNIADRSEHTNELIDEWYMFMWDRTRAIRKDLTHQDVSSVSSALLLEQCARFHIHCAERLVDQDASVYDDKINTENLTKCLQTLKYIYNDFRSDAVCENMAEFLAYSLLLNLNNTAIMTEIRNIPEDVISSPFIRFALDISAAREMKNYIRFFKLVKSTTYLNGCILRRYFNEMRVYALFAIVRSHCRQRATVSISVLPLVDALMYESLSECISHLRACNLTVETRDGEKYVILDRKTFQKTASMTLPPSTIYVRPKKTVPLSELIWGGPLPPQEYSDIQVSFTPDGDFKMDTIRWDHFKSDVSDEVDDDEPEVFNVSDDDAEDVEDGIDVEYIEDVPMESIFQAEQIPETKFSAKESVAAAPTLPLFSKPIDAAREWPKMSLSNSVPDAAANSKICEVHVLESEKIEHITSFSTAGTPAFSFANNTTNLFGTGRTLLSEPLQEAVESKIDSVVEKEAQLTLQKNIDADKKRLDQLLQEKLEDEDRQERLLQERKKKKEEELKLQQENIQKKIAEKERQERLAEEHRLERLAEESKRKRIEIQKKVAKVKLRTEKLAELRKKYSTWKLRVFVAHWRNRALSMAQKRKMEHYSKTLRTSYPPVCSADLLNGNPAGIIIPNVLLLRRRSPKKCINTPARNVNLGPPPTLPLVDIGQVVASALASRVRSLYPDASSQFRSYFPWKLIISLPDREETTVQLDTFVEMHFVDRFDWKFGSETEPLCFGVHNTENIDLDICVRRVKGISCYEGNKENPSAVCGANSLLFFLIDDLKALPFARQRLKNIRTAPGIGVVTFVFGTRLAEGLVRSALNLENSDAVLICEGDNEQSLVTTLSGSLSLAANIAAPVPTLRCVTLTSLLKTNFLDQIWRRCEIAVTNFNVIMRSPELFITHYNKCLDHLLSIFSTPKKKGLFLAPEFEKSLGKLESLEMKSPPVINDTYIGRLRKCFERFKLPQWPQKAIKSTNDLNFRLHQYMKIITSEKSLKFPKWRIYQVIKNTLLWKGLDIFCEENIEIVLEQFPWVRVMREFALIRLENVIFTPDMAVTVTYLPEDIDQFCYGVPLIIPSNDYQKESSESVAMPELDSLLIAYTRAVDRQAKEPMEIPSSCSLQEELSEIWEATLPTLFDNAEPVKSPHIDPGLKRAFDNLDEVKEKLKKRRKILEEMLADNNCANVS